MAEAFLKRLAGDDFSVENCGFEANDLNPRWWLRSLAKSATGNITQAALDLFKQVQARYSASS